MSISREDIPCYMDEVGSDIEVICVGRKYIWGLSEGQPVLMTKTMYEKVEIYAEHEPIGTQPLKTEDIIEELNKIDKRLLKYISCIVLSPLEDSTDDNFKNRYNSEKDEKPIAIMNPDTMQISIFARPCNRNDAKELISGHMTLIHEIGHLIDYKFGKDNKTISESKEWEYAVGEDTKIKKTEDDLPKYYVSLNSEKTKNIREDFADSFIYFMLEKSKEWFRINYKNRNRILEELWKHM